MAVVCEILRDYATGFLGDGSHSVEGRNPGDLMQMSREDRRSYFMVVRKGLLRIITVIVEND
jgi:hypothetical protein